MRIPFLSAPDIRLTTVDLGTRSIQIPVAEFEGKRPGKTLLITGGMDGDEYTGMEASYRLVERYRDRNFAGRLIIIPIVNIPGFEGECSWNPMDMRFPKHIYPGNPAGMPTARLVSWLTQTHASRANLWHDMHAGSITEGLRPFVWLHETGKKDTDALMRLARERFDADLFVAERVSGASKAGALAKHGCGYILTESGQRGERDETCVARQVVWAESSMALLGMIDAPATSKRAPEVLTVVTYDRSALTGLWRPVLPVPKKLVRGQVIGTCLRLDGTGMRDVRASTSGTPLWWKETMKIQKDELVVAIGS